MELKVAVALIRQGVRLSELRQTWADLGSGSGLFSRALLEVLPHGSKVLAVEKSKPTFAKTPVGREEAIVQIKGDFERDDLGLSSLDGILMANSIHYVRDKAILLKKLAGFLKSSGRLVIVEYDLERANPWVPFPISLSRLQALAMQTGLGTAEFLHQVPSALNRANIYSALIQKNAKAES